MLLPSPGALGCSGGAKEGRRQSGGLAAGPTPRWAPTDSPPAGGAPPPPPLWLGPGSVGPLQSSPPPVHRDHCRGQEEREGLEELAFFLNKMTPTCWAT